MISDKLECGRRPGGRLFERGSFALGHRREGVWGRKIRRSPRIKGRGDKPRIGVRGDNVAAAVRRGSPKAKWCVGDPEPSSGVGAGPCACPSVGQPRGVAPTAGQDHVNTVRANDYSPLQTDETSHVVAQRRHVSADCADLHRFSKGDYVSRKDARIAKGKSIRVLSSWRSSRPFGYAQGRLWREDRFWLRPEAGLGHSIFSFLIASVSYSLAENSASRARSSGV